MNVKTVFGNRIKQLRLNNNYSMQELANKLNVTKSRINMWENGGSIPKNDILIKLSELFNVSIDFLLGNGDSKEIKKERGYKKTKADLMFEDLGYKLEIYQEEHKNEWRPSHYETVIAYCDDNINEEQRRRFEFFTERKEFIKKEKYWRSNEELWFEDTITMKELQAINEKCKEMGWI